MATTLNDSYQSTPLTVPQGGFGVATNTAYGLLAAGTTATAAIQQAGTGTTGQMYVSGGASALGTWTKGSTTTTMQFISSQTASSSASIIFTGLSSTYFAYKIIIDAVVPATNATNLYLLFSSDNGVSYYNSAAQYAYFTKTRSESAAGPGLGSVSDTQIILTTPLANTANTASHLEITLVNPSVSSTGNGVTHLGRYNNSTNGMSLDFGQGVLLVNTAVNAMKFLMSSGNISTGTFSLWGALA